ncbi:MAG: hypothetical protein HYZ90_04170, partial [Candidatus Omnitrophica bacterium]|nr:hypothetical protein [Candidatus Omnitrophota bacterium]
MFWASNNREMDDYCREVLTELTKRDREIFRPYSALAQRPGRTATNVANELLTSILSPEGIGQTLRRSDRWRGIESYARRALERMNERRSVRAQRREAVKVAMAAHGLDFDFLKGEYELVEAYGLSPGEAIRFAEDPNDLKGWRDYTETFVKNISKQISGVEARFDRATREALRSLGISQDLLDSTLLGLLRVGEGQIQATPNVLDLIGELTGKSKGELLRVGLHHEGSEILLRLYGAEEEIRRALNRRVVPADLKEFWDRFEGEFGEVDEENRFFEAASQYLTARFSNDVDKLDRIFGQGIGLAIEEALRGVSLP